MLYDFRPVSVLGKALAVAYRFECLQCNSSLCNDHHMLTGPCNLGGALDRVHKYKRIHAMHSLHER